VRWVPAVLVVAVLGASGCGHLWRVGALVVTDEQGHVGALAVGAIGGGLGAADEAANTRSYAVTVTAGVRGGVLDAAPSGMGAVDLGLDVVELWQHVGFRVGALGLVGGVGGGPGGHFAGGLGARLALLPIVRARVGLIAGRPGPCWGRDVQAIGLEAGAAYLFGPDRAMFSFGPMYEQIHGEGGNCD
jgi:hypothetical protein